MLNIPRPPYSMLGYGRTITRTNMNVLINNGPGAGGGRNRRGKKGNLPNTFDDDCSYMPQIWGIVFEDLDPRVSFFSLVGVGFLVLSLDRVLKLYKVKAHKRLATQKQIFCSWNWTFAYLESDRYWLVLPLICGTRKFARLSCGISADGRLFCDFIWVLWAFQVLHISIGMQSGRMTQCYININC